MAVINYSAIRRAKSFKTPYSFLTGDDILYAEAIPDIQKDFPRISKPGYLTVDKVHLQGRFKDLVCELEGPELTEELSHKFGLDLHPFPRLTTIMKHSQPRYGAIHTDGDSKVMTLLVYLNDHWEDNNGGRLRVLYNDKDYDSYAAEIPPITGSFFAFVRSDNSWHGHKPFAGERKVVQVAWLRSLEDLDRKKKNNKISQFFKGIFRL